jgi:hypothetical protein
MAVRVYVEDGDGLPYRVYDVQFNDGKSKRLPLGDATANYRVFVPESGPHRLHKFGRADDHGITEPQLERQLRSAGFAPTQKFDGSELTPDRRARE